MNAGELYNGQLGLNELVAQIDREISEALRLQPAENDQLEISESSLELGGYIALAVGGLQLAFPQQRVLEAGFLTRAEPLPLLPDWILGITNIRGEIISVVDLRLFFGLEAKKLKTEHPFIMLSNNNIKTVVIGDTVIGSRTVYQDDSEGDVEMPMVGEMKFFVSGRGVCKGPNGKEDVYLFDVDTFLESSKMTFFLQA